MMETQTEDMALLKPYKTSVNTRRIISKLVKRVLEDPSIAVTELIANAWDAGATRVEIHLPEKEGGDFFITDNGLGMSDEDFRNKWNNVGYNREESLGKFIKIEHQKYNTIKRRTFGKNGIGKFAAFCFSDSINIETSNNGTGNSYLIKIDIVDGLFDTKNTSKYPSDISGTKISATDSKISCFIPQIKSFVSQRFLYDPSFEIIINKEKISLDSIPENYIDKASVELESGEKIDIVMISKEESDKTTRWSGVAWIVNGRLVGDLSWDVFNSGKILDGRKYLAKKYSILITADALRDAVNEDWTGFDTASSVYKDAIDKISDVLNNFFYNLTKEDRAGRINSVKNQTRSSREPLPIIQREKVDVFIERVVENCPSIKEDILVDIVNILGTLEETSGKFGVVKKLASLTVDEWEKLNTILDEWTITMAKEVLDEIQGRMKIIAELRRLTEDESTLEVQELQPLMERCLWIFGPEFESIEYTSNKDIASCFQKYLGKKINGVSKNRPDFTIVPDGVVSFYSTPEYDKEHAEIGIRKLIILELKAPNVFSSRSEERRVGKECRSRWSPYH